MIVLIKSTFLDRTILHIREINPSMENNVIWVRGRLHTSRGTGRQCFIVLRDQQATMQAIVFVGEKISKQMVKYCSKYVEILCDDFKY